MWNRKKFKNKITQRKSTWNFEISPKYIQVSAKLIPEQTKPKRNWGFKKKKPIRKGLMEKKLYLSLQNMRWVENFSHSNGAHIFSVGKLLCITQRHGFFFTAESSNTLTSLLPRRWKGLLASLSMVWSLGPLHWEEDDTHNSGKQNTIAAWVVLYRPTQNSKYTHCYLNPS